MKKAYLLEKVRFKCSGKNGRLIWAVVVGQKEGLSLLYVRKPDENWSDTLVVAIQNPEQHYWEEANRFVFPVEHSDMSDIGGKLAALGEDESEAALRELFKPEDLF